MLRSSIGQPGWWCSGSEFSPRVMRSLSGTRGRRLKGGERGEAGRRQDRRLGKRGTLSGTRQASDPFRCALHSKSPPNFQPNPVFHQVPSGSCSTGCGGFRFFQWQFVFFKKSCLSHLRGITLNCEELKVWKLKIIMKKPYGGKKRDYWGKCKMIQQRKITNNNVKTP